VARTARNAGWQTAVAWLLIAAACATVQQPPGGPPDFEPPALIGTVPDSGAILPAFDDEVDFRFNEVITEGSQDALQRLIQVSPRHEEIDVSWRRSRLTVKPSGGWRDSVTYVVSLLPGITDLRSNRLDSGRTVVFSTGGEIPNTTVSGTVVDWEAGRVAAAALVELIRPGDSLTYWAVADSTGSFALSFVPPGAYLLVATIDANANGEREPREAFDSVTVSLDSAVTHALWTFVHDTIGPRISDLQLADSTALRVTFGQALAPDSLPPLEGIDLLLLPDSTPVPIARTMWPAEFDSLQAAVRDSLRAIADSVARDSLAGDSLAPDTLAADTVVADTAGARQPPPPLATPDSLEGQQDTVAVSPLLDDRLPLRRSFVIIVDPPLQAGARYVLRTTVTNVLGIAETTMRAVLVPAPPDSS